MSGKKAAPAAKAPAGGAAKGKAAPAAKAPTKADGPPADKNILFPSQPKNFRIGNDVMPKKRDLSRFVKWPRNVRLQRQKKVIYDRLKVPPSINQFTKPLDRAEALPFFQLLAKYQPEDKAAKTARLEAEGVAKAGGKPLAKEKPLFAKCGLNHVTQLVEEKKAKLVVIAADVNPVELVLWLPALCRRMGVPYVIVNNKGRLGSIVRLKKSAVLALTEVRGEDKSALDKLVDIANAKFVNNKEMQRKWGGGLMGLKTNAALEKRAKMMAAEAAKRAAL